MNSLHPDMMTITRAYAPWLGQHGDELLSAAAGIDTGHDVGSESALLASADADLAAAADTGSTTSAPPDFIADTIRRQVQARPQLRAPQAGDVVLLQHPLMLNDCDNNLASALPLVVVLDNCSEQGWSGWLVGAHSDYAGDRDLVLDPSHLLGDVDPAPLAGMVMCWNRVQVPLFDECMVMHQLTPLALQIITTMAQHGAMPQDDQHSAGLPGRLCRRRVLGHTVMTGSPYLLDDPRTPYLRLMQLLGRGLADDAIARGGPAPRHSPQQPQT